jgi:hypothetical protein
VLAVIWRDFYPQDGFVYVTLMDALLTRERAQRRYWARPDHPLFFRPVMLSPWCLNASMPQRWA